MLNEIRGAEFLDGIQYIVVLSNNKTWCMKVLDLLLHCVHYYCCWFSLYRENWLRVVTALTERRDVNVNYSNNQGETPLHIACQ